MNKFNELIKNSILFDSHCHFNEDIFEVDRGQIIKDMTSVGVDCVFDIGTNFERSVKAIENSSIYPNKVFASVGVDMETCVPDSDLYVEDFGKVLVDFNSVEDLLNKNSKIEMIGETGIDLYWNRVKNLSKELSEVSFNEQKELFIRHLKLAERSKLPLTIHSRDSIDECVEVIKQGGLDVFGVFHSLTPDFDDNESSFYRKIKTIHEMGFYVGLNGIVTFKNANLLRQTIFKVIRENNKDKKIGLDEIYNSKFVFETDGPFLAPEGKRGERNVPGNVSIIFDICKKAIN